MAPMVALTAAAASGLPANVDECSSGSALGAAQNSGADATPTPPTGITPPPRRILLPVSSGVRGDAGQVGAPPGAQPAQAGLDLVEDHHRTGLGARLPDLFQVAVRRQPDTTPQPGRVLSSTTDSGREHGPERREVAEQDEDSTIGSSGPNGSRNCARPVTDSAPSVLPWKPPCIAITWRLPASRASFRPTSVASAPEFVRKA